MRKRPRFADLSLKGLPKTVQEQLSYLVDERGYTITQAVIMGIRLLHQEEYAVQVEEHEARAEE